MKRQQAWFATVVLLGGLLVLGRIAHADPATIEGLVNEKAQVVTDDGEAYDLAPTDLGKTVARLVGTRVVVTGTIEEREKRKTITVDRYLVIDEDGRISMRSGWGPPIDVARRKKGLFFDEQIVFLSTA